MKTDFYSFLLSLSLGIVFILCGTFMILNNLIGYGIRSLTQNQSAISGHLFILIGILFLVVSYFSLSPFGRIRKFIEGSIKKRTKLKK